jgi:hypothetical protein
VVNINQNLLKMGKLKNGGISMENVQGIMSEEQKSEIQKAGLKALRNLKGVDQSAVESFPERLAASGAAVLGAKADLTFILFYGKLTVKPTTNPYTEYCFDVDVWGAGGMAGSSIGFMYTAYDNWDAFFQNVTAYHVQGVSGAVGFLQVNWFNKSGTPVGQFNGGTLGGGALEAGGSGKWAKKKC